jgi:hypothetical protein
MDALIILFGFTILSWMFYKYSQEIKEIQPHLSIIFFIGSLLFLVVTAGVIFHAANIGNEVLANKTINYTYEQQEVNKSIYNNESVLTGFEIMNATILMSQIETLQYTNSSRFAPFAMSEPLVVMVWLIWGIIAIYMLNEFIKLIESVRSDKDKSAGFGG